MDMRVYDEEKDDPPVDMTLEENRYHYVIPDAESTPVTNQKQEGSCHKWACADMFNMVLRTDHPGLVTSPQPIIDLNPTVRSLIHFCVKKPYGLESVNDYPVIRIGRNYFDLSLYQTSPWARYRLHDLVYCDLPNKMKNKILGMFSESGYRFPILAVMRMGRLSNKNVARRYALGPRPPYRHPPSSESDPSSSESLGVQHAMLIIGVNTTSDNFAQHYCVVKNSYGKTWGDGGKSRVAFDVFEYLMCPVCKCRKQRAEEEKKKKERREKKREEKEKEKAKGKKVEEDNSQGGDAGAKRVEEEHEGRDAAAGGSAKMRLIVEEPDDGDDGGVAVGGGSVKKRKRVAGGGSIKKRKQVDNEQEKGKTDMENQGHMYGLRND